MIAFVEDFFCIDRDRVTCTGGVAPLDLMLAVIAPGSATASRPRSRRSS